MITKLKGVKVTLEFESIEISEEQPETNLAKAILSSIQTLVKEQDELKDLITQKLS